MGSPLSQRAENAPQSLVLSIESMGIRTNQNIYEAKADKLTDWAIDPFTDDVVFGETEWVQLCRNEQKTRLKVLYSASNQWVNDKPKYLRSQSR
jgi:hypothetical protein